MAEATNRLNCYLALMKIVGLTGGIGSGKSTVARVFQILNTPVFDSDSVAKRAYFDDLIRHEVIALAGEEVYIGQDLQREVLATKVFNNADLLARLNALIHPWVADQWTKWLKAQTHPYVIREAAILLESGSHSDCDEIVLVSAPESLRIQRVMRRDGITDSHIQQRMSNQWTDDQRRPFVSHELVNDERRLIVPEVIQLHETWMKFFN